MIYRVKIKTRTTWPETKGVSIYGVSARAGITVHVPKRMDHILIKTNLGYWRYENFFRFLSICIHYYKLITKVTESLTEHTKNISRYKLLIEKQCYLFNLLDFTPNEQVKTVTVIRSTQTHFLFKNTPLNIAHIDLNK